MSAQRTASKPADGSVTLDGFEVLDGCHRQMLQMLGDLDALMARLATGQADDTARSLAESIVRFFSTTSRQHHEDEERHVFPKLVTRDDPDLVQAVLRLQQDHDWLEEDWMELQPQIDAIAGGQGWVDLDVLRESAEIFSALLQDHIALEESWIYPEARAGANDGERREMGREMAARRRQQRAGKRGQAAGAAPRA